MSFEFWLTRRKANAGSPSPRKALLRNDAPPVQEAVAGVGGVAETGPPRKPGAADDHGDAQP
jgi:hypothetical protein